MAAARYDEGGPCALMLLPPVYPILDTATLARHAAEPLPTAAALLEAGAKLLQFRHKAPFTRVTLTIADDMARLCREAGCGFVVNDRPDIAVLLDAGCHVGQDDLLPSDARRILGPDRLLGYSTHNEPQFEEGLREPVSYLALGPIFGTASKENPDPMVGLDRLASLAHLSALPLVAIGGITLAQAPDVWRAGAASIAVISDLFADGPEPSAIRSRTEQWLRLAR